MMSVDELEFHLAQARREYEKAIRARTSAAILEEGWRKQIEALETVIAKLKDEVPAGRV